MEVIRNAYIIVMLPYTETKVLMCSNNPIILYKSDIVIMAMQKIMVAIYHKRSPT